MRDRKPRREQRRILSLCLPEGFELPGSVIEIVEIIANLHCDAANMGDGVCSLNAASHRAGVDCARLPAAGNSLGNRNGLRTSLIGEFKRLATSKPWWLNAFDVPVANK